MSTPASGRKVKFVATDPSRGGLPLKRKQVQHACESCRRKKRRCIHAEDAPDDASPEDSRGADSSPSHASPNNIGRSVTPVSRVSLPPPVANANGILGRPQEQSFQPPNRPNGKFQRPHQDGSFRTRSSRFVGDLNPEGMFIEATASVSARESSQKGDVGIWLPAGGSQSSQFITSRPPPIMDRFLLPFVKEHCLSCLPPDDDYAKLKATFIQKIHPIFPVLPLSSLNEPAINPTSIIQRQLVCLAAGSDPDMTQFLRLQNKGGVLLSPQDYSQALSSSVRAILETSLITDRVAHIQALAMLSFYVQPTCAEEADLPAQLGGRAIHHIQTLGLHLLRYDAPNCDDLNNLFCAVWALDRINAAMYGRPCLMHERDIGADLDACIRKRPPCFRLLLFVIQWLDQVVELYRPGPSEEASGVDKVAYIDLPVLEAMIVNADALKVSSSLIATIETFYHAVIILSCRLPRPGTAPAASTLPPPSANARRSLAADRIACAVPRDCLSPAPFVPYAVSLALSVEYRKMRHSRLPMFRARAMSSFKRNCELLRRYSNHFWNANVVAGLGERVLKEMERAATTLNKDHTPPVAAAESTLITSAQTMPTPGITELPLHDPDGVNAAIDSAIGMDNTVNFSLVDPVSGQDVFGHIDPSFNLDAVEDALEANLDIGLPFTWGDWGHYAT
ncbi:Transcription factor [Cordyceps fumosorosea ARSEF 2679]|uniref:Transcription factor n=1 Tax=Cordyceps fumosorosea (strain ARSEF 2679) TaxID=1081104 RepID=A0A167QMI0_CORFA|nr:Transcription factor [Cordyceps fumosorosea ARSEF 2679]OAA57775.1 Transcription factor [Cordyceps fumosorosea ARSEF 2679]